MKMIEVSKQFLYSPIAFTEYRGESCIMQMVQFHVCMLNRTEMNVSKNIGTETTFISMT